MGRCHSPAVTKALGLGWFEGKIRSLRDRLKIEVFVKTEKRKYDLYKLRVTCSLEDPPLTARCSHHDRRDESDAGSCQCQSSCACQFEPVVARNLLVFIVHIEHVNGVADAPARAAVFIGADEPESA